MPVDRIKYRLTIAVQCAWFVHYIFFSGLQSIWNHTSGFALQRKQKKCYYGWKCMYENICTFIHWHFGTLELKFSRPSLWRDLSSGVWCLAVCYLFTRALYPRRQKQMTIKHLSDKSVKMAWNNWTYRFLKTCNIILKTRQHQISGGWWYSRVFLSRHSFKS